MTDKSCYLAIDIGASSGRHILGWMENGKLRLEEIYRFENRLETMHGHLCWNLAHLFDEVVAGLKECAALRRIPQSIGIDTWGVDFVLLDEQGQMLGDPISYRDSRTQGMDELVRQKISDEDLYARTGIQKQPFNTIYQLVALRAQEPELLARAHRFLMVPEYLNYLLTGAMVNEYTKVFTGPIEATAIGNLIVQMLEDKVFADLPEVREAIARSFDVKRTSAWDESVWREKHGI